MKTKIVFIIISLILSSCISSEYVNEDKKNNDTEIYVFDDVTKIDTTKIIQEESKIVTNEIKENSKDEKKSQLNFKYTVQVGAFTSKERAETFINQNQNKTSFPLKIVFNKITNLYSVQIPPYNTKEEADKIKDILKNFPPFKEAFTIQIEN